MFQPGFDTTQINKERYTHIHTYIFVDKKKRKLKNKSLQWLSCSKKGGFFLNIVEYDQQFSEILKNFEFDTKSILIYLLY